MNSKKRAFLKKKAHNLEPIVRIGKEGLNQNIVQSILDAIASRELIKVKILQNCEEEKTVIYSKLMDIKDFEVVGMIGRTIIIFKENKENPSISLEWKNIYFPSLKLCHFNGNDGTFIPFISIFTTAPIERLLLVVSCK